MHWSFTNNAQDITVNLIAETNGSVWGTITYLSIEFPVIGTWQASGSIPGRVTSNFQLSGRYFNKKDVPYFIAVSGLIKGSAPNMGPMDLVVQAASSFNGTLSQTPVQLAYSLQQPEPAAVTAMPTGGTNIPWKFSSPDGNTVMEVWADLDGTVSGILTKGNAYSVAGQWAGRELAPGRCASVFWLIGGNPVVPGAYDLLAVAGVVTGDYESPQKIELFGSVALISQYENEAFKGTLLPISEDDSAVLGAAYAESYMVIQIGGPHDNLRAVNGWYGPISGDNVGRPFGSSVYQTNGVQMNPTQLANILSPLSQPTTDPRTIKIPSIKGAKGKRPVMIQFMGDAGHFEQPPLKESHKDIPKVFYDGQVQALVLQYMAVRGGSRSAPINFKGTRFLNHNSVIIEPF